MMLILLTCLGLSDASLSDDQLRAQILRVADSAKAYRSDWAARELAAAQATSCDRLSVVNAGHKALFSATLARMRKHVESLVSSISPVSHSPADMDGYINSLDARLDQVEKELSKSKTDFLSTQATSQKEVEEILKNGVIGDTSSKSIETNDYMQAALQIFFRSQQLKLVKKAVESLKKVLEGGASFSKFLEKPRSTGECPVTALPVRVKDPLGIERVDDYSTLDRSEALNTRQIRLEIAISVKRQEEAYEAGLLKHVTEVNKELEQFDGQAKRDLLEMQDSASKLLATLQNALRDTQGLSAGARHDLILLTRLNERKANTAFRGDDLFLGDCPVTGGELIDSLLKCL